MDFAGTADIFTVTDSRPSGKTGLPVQYEKPSSGITDDGWKIRG